jgi:hypothetical protein
LLFADIAVATTDEVDFFSEEGKIIDRLKKPTANLRSLELDPVNQMLFLTDDTDSNYSIFTLSLKGNQDLKPFIQSGYFLLLGYGSLLLSDFFFWKNHNWKISRKCAKYYYQRILNTLHGTTSVLIYRSTVVG